ncbi:2',3'-cyclic-nucleotide 3'-phosphodiesterase-like [Antedon mediterranea]|uniref:2',3'-cyclic-nucleotide 3'-phosphodiesterase-like n=1 Tax=Antedon mediterranea TaxID=105859 RepID=UPI003AF969EA
MKSVEDAVKDGVRMIIIDNASELIDDMQELYTFALNNHYIEMAIKSGIGESMYVPISPTFFGWFLNEADSKELRQYGKKVLKGSFHVKDFADDFRKHCEEPSIKDLTSYFTADYIDVGDTMLHCTSMYHAQDGFKEYTKRVAGHIGQVFSIKVLGFLITPRTFGARLKLDNGALTLWDSTDHPDTKQWEPSFFSPTNGRGSRAHLSLLTAPGVKAVQTGVDLTELVKDPFPAILDVFGKIIHIYHFKNIKPCHSLS